MNCASLLTSFIIVYSWDLAIHDNHIIGGSGGMNLSPIPGKYPMCTMLSYHSAFFFFFSMIVYLYIPLPQQHAKSIMNCHYFNTEGHLSHVGFRTKALLVHLLLRIPPTPLLSPDL